jgi:hypothetical protein
MTYCFGEKRSKSMIRDYMLPLDRTRMIRMILNPDKCKFRVTEVTYLGHKLTGEGVQPDQTKIEAIIDMPAPQEKTRGAEAIRNGELPSQVYSRNVRDYGTELLKKHVLGTGRRIIKLYLRK